MTLSIIIEIKLSKPKVRNNYLSPFIRNNCGLLLGYYCTTLELVYVSEWLCNLVLKTR